MRITKVAFTRKFNLGNYESLDVHAEAELNDKDNPLESWSILRDNTEMWFIDQQRKKPSEQQNTPVEQPQEKDYFKTDQLTVWQPFPETDKNQGRWEKNTQTENPQFKAIVQALQSVGTQLHSKDPNALYWLLTDEGGKVTGLARRRDEWRKHK